MYRKKKIKLSTRKVNEIRRTGSWVCRECGEYYGRERNTMATWHMGVCDLCGHADPVTEFRDFNYLRK